MNHLVDIIPPLKNPAILPTMPTHLSLFLLHAPACTPDAGFVDLIDNDNDEKTDVDELEHLLDEDDSRPECQCCGRRKKHQTFDAYPEQSYPQVIPRRRPPPEIRGCKRLLISLLHIACCYRSRRKFQLITRYQYHKQKKPFSAVSVHVEQLTSETYEEDDLAGVPELLEVIKLQATGSQEVARALRKKLKYGNAHRQLRALSILDGLLQNGGSRVQRALLSDGPLLERLRIAAVDPLSDQDVRTKCKDLFGQWVSPKDKSHSTS